LVLKQLCLLAIASTLASAATTDQTSKTVKHPAHPHSATAVKSATKSAASSKKPATTASKTAAKGTKPVASKSRSAGARSKTAKSTHVARSYQQAPTPERYKAIQEALVAKGYLQGEPNGVWGSESVEALKRFQTDQNLTPDGKLSALSLVALGLGPKRLTAQSGQQPAADGPK